MLVVGGGVTGAGVALDAATRGLRTALVEADDFASGTSSKSSKLVHGGLRYLQQGDVRLVYEALHERQRLRNNAPHLVKLLPFMIPVLTKDGLIPAASPGRWARRCGCTTSRAGPASASSTSGSTPTTAFTHLPTMPRERLAGGYLYYDATTDDARLVLTIVRTAAEHGAVAANRCRVVGPDQGRLPATSTGPRSTPATGSSTSRRESSSTPPACGPTRCARSRTASTPTRSARRRACTSPCRGTRCATTSPSSSRSAATSAACSSCRGDRSATARSATPTSAPPTPTTTARSTTRRAPPTTSPTCCAPSTRRSRPASRSTTSPACGPGCGRSSSRRRAGGPPTSRGATG